MLPMTTQVLGRDVFVCLTQNIFTDLQSMLKITTQVLGRAVFVYLTPNIFTGLQRMLPMTTQVLGRDVFVCLTHSIFKGLQSMLLDDRRKKTKGRTVRERASSNSLLQCRKGVSRGLK